MAAIEVKSNRILAQRNCTIDPSHPLSFLPSCLPSSSSSKLSPQRKLQGKLHLPCRCLQKRSYPASHAALAVGQPGSHAWRRAAAGRALGGPAQRQRRGEAGSFRLSSETASWEMPPSGSIFVQISMKILEPNTLQVEVTLRNQKKVASHWKNEQKILTVLLLLSLTLVPKAGLQRGFLVQLRVDPAGEESSRGAGLLVRRNSHGSKQPKAHLHCLHQQGDGAPAFNVGER